MFARHNNNNLLRKTQVSHLVLSMMQNDTLKTEREYEYGFISLSRRGQIMTQPTQAASILNKRYDSADSTTSKPLEGAAVPLDISLMRKNL